VLLLVWSTGASRKALVTLHSALAGPGNPGPLRLEHSKNKQKGEKNKKKTLFLAVGMPVGEIEAHGDTAFRRLPCRNHGAVDKVGRSLPLPRLLPGQGRQNGLSRMLLFLTHSARYHSEGTAQLDRPATHEHLKW